MSSRHPGLWFRILILLFLLGLLGNILKEAIR